MIPDNKYEHYSYILCYVDDIIVIHYDSLSILNNIDKYLTFKPSLIGETDIYLGAKLRKMTITNSVWCWSIIPYKYFQEAVRNCETNMKDKCGGRYFLVKDAANPFSYYYEPEVDVFDPLDPEMESYYQSLIGIM